MPPVCLFAKKLLLLRGDDPAPAGDQKGTPKGPVFDLDLPRDLMGDTRHGAMRGSWGVDGTNEAAKVVGGAPRLLLGARRCHRSDPAPRLENTTTLTGPRSTVRRARSLRFVQTQFGMGHRPWSAGYVGRLRRGRGSHKRLGDIDRRQSGCARRKKKKGRHAGMKAQTSVRHHQFTGTAG